MKKETKTVLKKTVKVAGVTCFALGGAALIASGAALKALAEGAKFVKNSIKEILDEKSNEDTTEVVDAEVNPAEQSGVEVEAPEAEIVEAEETAAE